MTKHQSDQSDKNVPWGALEAVLVTFAVFLSAQILAGVLVLVYGGLRGWSESATSVWLDSTSGNFWVIFASEMLTIGLLTIFIRRRRGTLEHLGLRRLAPGDAAAAVLGFGWYFLLLMATMILAGALIPGSNFEQQQELGFSTSPDTDLLPVFIALVILPPLVEEILFRGFLYRGLRTKFNRTSAALVTSLMFATPHLQFGTGNPLLWTAFADTFLLSLVSINLLETTKGIWASIGLHMIKNGWAFVAVFVVR